MTPTRFSSRTPLQVDEIRGIPAGKEFGELKKVLLNQTKTKKGLLSKKDVSLTDAIVRNEKIIYEKSYLDAMGNNDRINKARKTARKRVQRNLIDNIPAAGKLFKQNKLSSAERSKVISKIYKRFSEASIPASFEVASADLLDYDEFRAPFELDRMNDPSFDFMLDGHTTNVIKNNTSFIDKESGELSLNYRFVQQGFLAHYDAFISTGVRYKVPKTGYLNIAAVARNIDNRLYLSITDDFGFSNAEFYVYHRIGICLVRSGESYIYDRLLVNEGLISLGGDDMFYIVPKFPTSSPYLLNITTKDAFLKGEEIEIRFYTWNTFTGMQENMMNDGACETLWLLDRLYAKVV